MIRIDNYLENLTEHLSKLEDGYTGERVSVTFEVSPDKRDMLLRLVTQKK